MQILPRRGFDVIRDSPNVGCVTVMFDGAPPDNRRGFSPGRREKEDSCIIL